jgi:hypothetical protein
MNCSRLSKFRANTSFKRPRVQPAMESHSRLSRPDPSDYGDGGVAAGLADSGGTLEEPRAGPRGRGKDSEMGLQMDHGTGSISNSLLEDGRLPSLVASEVPKDLEKRVAVDPRNATRLEHLNGEPSGLEPGWTSKWTSGKRLVRS